MPQVEARQNHNKQTATGDILHIIANTPHSSKRIIPVFEVVQNVLEATGGGLLIFNEPRLLALSHLEEALIPPDEALQALAHSLGDGVHINPKQPIGSQAHFAEWVVGVIGVQNHVIGIAWLAFDDLSDTIEEQRDLLQCWLNGLKIIALDLRSDARHEKLGRNQSEFMRIVAHDLRSPLTSMQGFASMLESAMVGELNEKQAHFVEKILAGITQMTSLVDNIQDAGRYDPETGFYEMQRDQCDLAEIVQRIVRNHIMPAEKQDLNMTANIADDVPIIYADVNMLERAITNLVDNAIKYTPNGRNIQVGARRKDDMVIVSVKDNGLGISQENQKHLFERHVRIPRKEHKRVKGSGLGLFIVRSVARRHGGEAWVESEDGLGSTFYISIPLNEDNALVRN